MNAIDKPLDVVIPRESSLELIRVLLADPLLNNEEVQQYASEMVKAKEEKQHDNQRIIIPSRN